MRLMWRGLELPSRVVPDMASMTDCYGKFAIEPFERGFGVTVGSSLQRVLLSTLEGSAITAVCIRGVDFGENHIPGVVEDVQDVLQNIKGLVVRNGADFPSKVKAVRSERGVLRARDVVHGPGVEILNPEHVIATLAEDVELDLELTITNGRGYCTKEDLARGHLQALRHKAHGLGRCLPKLDSSKLEKFFEKAEAPLLETAAGGLSQNGRVDGSGAQRLLDEFEAMAANNVQALGVLRELREGLDSFTVGRVVEAGFSPVTKVKYETVETRVGQRTNYDRLVLEIWTKGSTSPSAALVEAAKILRKHLNPFIQYCEPGLEVSIDDRLEQSGGGALDSYLERKLSLSVADLDLSVRALNCLETEGITTVRDLVSRSDQELLEVRNFGETSLKEVKEKLQEEGLSLGMKLPGYKR